LITIKIFGLKKEKLLFCDQDNTVTGCSWGESST